MTKAILNRPRIKEQTPEREIVFRKDNGVYISEMCYLEVEFSFARAAVLNGAISIAIRKNLHYSFKFKGADQIPESNEYEIYKYCGQVENGATVPFAFEIEYKPNGDTFDPYHPVIVLKVRQHDCDYENKMKVETVAWLIKSSAE